MGRKAKPIEEILEAQPAGEPNYAVDWKERALDDLDRVVITEYLKDFHRTKALQRAGVRSTYQGLRKRATMFFGRPEVRLEIRARVQARQQRAEITADNLLRELNLIATFNIEDAFDLDEEGGVVFRPEKLSREQWAAIESVTIDKDGKTKIKAHSKIEATKKLGEHLRLWRSDDASPLAPVTFNIYGSDRPPPPAD